MRWVAVGVAVLEAVGEAAFLDEDFSQLFARAALFDRLVNPRLSRGLSAYAGSIDCRVSYFLKVCHDPLDSRGGFIFSFERAILEGWRRIYVRRRSLMRALDVAARVAAF